MRCRCGRRTRSRIAVFNENNNLIFISAQVPPRQHHHLQGESVRAPPRPLTPAPAHTKHTLTPGRAAYAATNHHTSRVPRGQVRVRDDHRTGGDFSPSCASSTSRSCSRRERWLLFSEEPARAEHSVGTRVSVGTRCLSVRMHVWDRARAS